MYAYVLMYVCMYVCMLLVYSTGAKKLLFTVGPTLFSHTPRKSSLIILGEFFLKARQIPHIIATIGELCLIKYTKI